MLLQQLGGIHPGDNEIPNLSQYSGSPKNDDNFTHILKGLRPFRMKNSRIN